MAQLSLLKLQLYLLLPLFTALQKEEIRIAHLPRSPMSLSSTQFVVRKGWRSVPHLSVPGCGCCDLRTRNVDQSFTLSVCVVANMYISIAIFFGF